MRTAQACELRAERSRSGLNPSNEWQPLGGIYNSAFKDKAGNEIAATLNGLGCQSWFPQGFCATPLCGLGKAIAHSDIAFR